MHRLIAVMGPTASGKSAVAESLATCFDAQLINADAFHIYKGFDIGTNKPSDRARYELIDIKDPHEPFGVGEWLRLVHEILAVRDRDIVVVGGTGLYIRALFEEWSEMKSAPDPELRAELNRLQDEGGTQALARKLQSLDPQAAKTLDLENPARVKRAIERALTPSPPERHTIVGYSKFKFSLELSPAELRDRIDRRLEQMLGQGWVEEVKKLVKTGVQRTDPAMRAIGYRSVLDWIEGEISENEALESIRVQTRQYAKRQRTWLRSEPNLVRLDADTPYGVDASHAVRQIESFLSQANK